MWMNAKLQMTAAISMLTVATVLGHFLAVASWDTKETVLSANVSSNASVDIFRKAIVNILGDGLWKSLFFFRVKGSISRLRPSCLETDYSCDTYILFVIHLAKIRFTLAKMFGLFFFIPNAFDLLCLLTFLDYQSHNRHKVFINRHDKAYFLNAGAKTFRWLVFL